MNCKANRPLKPVWVNGAEGRPMLVSLPPTLKRVRDEKLAELRRKVWFWRVVAVASLAWIAVKIIYEVVP